MRGESQFQRRESYFPSPWDETSKYEFLFPLKDYEILLTDLSIDKEEFYDFWLFKNESLITYLSNKPNIEFDWIWAFYLPLLSSLINNVNSDQTPLMIAISELPRSFNI